MMNPSQAMVQAGPSGMAAMWHAHDVVSCRRKILAIAPTFEICDMQDHPLVFCQEKLFKIKDDIRIYADSSKNVELLRIKQRNIMDWAGLFDVFDPQSGAKIGAFRRKGWRSFLRDEWHLLDVNDQQVGTILETGTPFWRRIFKFLPYTFAFNVSGQQVGTFDQHFTFFGYRATMDITAWRTAPFDRRLAFAGALLLMAVEAKEDASR
ncbi:MAG TPA: hypothetical protein VIF09_22600 [Polyangiaceae bacterium]